MLHKNWLEPPLRDLGHFPSLSVSHNHVLVSWGEAKWRITHAWLNNTDQSWLMLIFICRMFLKCAVQTPGKSSPARTSSIWRVVWQFWPAALQNHLPTHNICFSPVIILTDEPKRYITAKPFMHPVTFKSNDWERHLCSLCCGTKPQSDKYAIRNLKGKGTARCTLLMKCSISEVHLL